MAIISDEVSKVVAAEVVMMPDWLGPPDPNSMALDYTRFKVRGFYTRSDTLTRYFRAVAWLQSIPFRVSYDDELLSILILGRCLAVERFGDDTETYEAYRRFFRTYTEFLGVGDDWDLVTAADATTGAFEFDIEATRAALIAQAEEEGGPQINDQLRFAPDDPNMVAEPNFRIVSAYRLPEAVLFQRTTDPRQFRERFLPNGLEVCIALGSTFAREKIEDGEKDKLLATIDENLDLFAGTSLFFDYLGAIATLLGAPEPNAPAFMADAPWQAKSCGTALAGWAQLRHTWVLQAKLNVRSSSRRHGDTLPSAFVEPDPDFFRQMTELAARTNDLLVEADALGSNYLGLIDPLNEVADLLDESEDMEDFAAVCQALSWDRYEQLQGVIDLVYDPDGDTEALAAWLRQIAADLGEGIVDPAVQWLVSGYDVELEELWPLLEETCLQLESIARKQLEGIDLSEDDESFLKAYGGRLKTLMLFNGETLDRAPRIADVYSNPDVSANLHVGISRARALYVLYPWEGDFVLCRGAVMPYYEFADSGRLTDTEWKARLDSDARPDVPSWLRPIITAEGLTAPTLDD